MGHNMAEQEYSTYYDKSTGHHRLKGGALEIRDPTDEDIKRNREEIMRELEEEEQKPSFEIDPEFDMSPSGYSEPSPMSMGGMGGFPGGAMNINASAFVPRATAPAF